MTKSPKLRAEIQAEARQQVEKAVSRWSKAIETFEFAEFIHQHRKETQVAKEEFEQIDAQVQEKLKRGARKTTGFIV